MINFPPKWQVESGTWWQTTGFQYTLSTPYFLYKPMTHVWAIHTLDIIRYYGTERERWGRCCVLLATVCRTIQIYGHFNGLVLFFKVTLVQTNPYQSYQIATYCTSHYHPQYSDNYYPVVCLRPHLIPHFLKKKKKPEANNPIGCFLYPIHEKPWNELQ